MEVKIRLNGRIPSKKNSKRRVVNSRGVFMVPSKNHQEWHEAAMWEVKAQKPNMGISRCEVMMVFHMPDNRKADLTNKAESVMDLLVDAGVLVDDSWQVVAPMTLNGFLDKKSPGVEIIISHDVDKYNK